MVAENRASNPETVKTGGSCTDFLPPLEENVLWGNILSGWPVNIEQQKTPTARCASHSAVEFIYLVVYVFIVFLGDEAIPIIKYPDFQVAFIFYLFVAVAFMGYFGSFPGFQFPDVISRYII